MKIKKTKGNDPDITIKFKIEEIEEVILCLKEFRKEDYYIFDFEKNAYKLRKKPNHTKLQEQLINYIATEFGTTPAKFSRFSKESNILPIGTKAVYEICRGKEVSRSQILLIKDFFKNLTK